MIADKGGSLEDAMLAEPESENSQVVQVRCVTKAECLDLPAITEKVRAVDLEKDIIKLYNSIEEETMPNWMSRM